MLIEGTPTCWAPRVVLHDPPPGLGVGWVGFGVGWLDGEVERWTSLRCSPSAAGKRRTSETETHPLRDYEAPGPRERGRWGKGQSMRRCGSHLNIPAERQNDKRSRLR
eukprot:11758455-Heterocapsa_arctica.AAC.1